MSGNLERATLDLVEYGQKYHIVNILQDAISDIPLGMAASERITSISIPTHTAEMSNLPVRSFGTPVCYPSKSINSRYNCRATFDSHISWFYGFSVTISFACF